MKFFGTIKNLIFFIVLFALAATAIAISINVLLGDVKYAVGATKKHTSLFNAFKWLKGGNTNGNFYHFSGKYIHLVKLTFISSIVTIAVATIVVMTTLVTFVKWAKGSKVFGIIRIIVSLIIMAVLVAMSVYVVVELALLNDDTFVTKNVT